MVALTEVQAANAHLKSNSNMRNLTALFVGGTSGVGESALKQFAKNTTTPNIYIAGRSDATLSRVIDELTTLNPEGKYTAIKTGDLSLIKSMDELSASVKQHTDHLDLLFQSQGYLSFSGRQETVEGLDGSFSIRYYARMRLINDLLPLLNASTKNPRVVVILAGGQETKLVEDDLSLRTNFSFGNALAHTGTMTTIYLERMAKENGKISFVHAYPGVVRTNLFNSDQFGFLVKFFINSIVMNIIGPFLLGIDEVGQRVLFAATDARYSSSSQTREGMRVESSTGVVGDVGSYSLDWNGEPKANQKVMQLYRENGVAQKVVDHTMQEFDRIVSMC